MQAEYDNQGAPRPEKYKLITSKENQMWEKDISTNCSPMKWQANSTVPSLRGTE